MIHKQDWDSIIFFRQQEFQCRCCGKIHISMELVKRLDLARSIAGIPFIVNSGYRCPAHNRAIGGSPTSSHMLGYAADIRTPDHITRYRIVAALLQAGFRRIVLYRDDGFVHVDVDPHKPQDILPVV